MIVHCTMVKIKCILRDHGWRESASFCDEIIFEQILQVPASIISRHILPWKIMEIRKFNFLDCWLVSVLWGRLNLRKSLMGCVVGSAQFDSRSPGIWIKFKVTKKWIGRPISPITNTHNSFVSVDANFCKTYFFTNLHREKTNTR